MTQVIIIAADFNKEIVGPMIAAAETEIEKLGGELVETRRVPGAYEIPLAASMSLPKADALVILGFIEKGETLHGQVMGQVVHQALIDLQLESGKSMGLGIIGPGATLAQAAKRNVDYAKAAVGAIFKYV